MIVLVRKLLSLPFPGGHPVGGLALPFEQNLVSVFPGGVAAPRTPGFCCCFLLLVEVLGFVWGKVLGFVFGPWEVAPRSNHKFHVECSKIMSGDPWGPEIWPRLQTIYFYTDRLGL